MRLNVRRAVSACVAVLAALGAIAAADAQVRKIDGEQVLASQMGFSPAEINQARAGKAVARLLPSRETTEVGVSGAVRITGSPDRLLYWLKEIANFRKAAELGLSRKLSDPPQIGDFADLTLSADELSALKACRPGNCDLRLGDKAIARFQAEVDWAAPDAAKRADLLTRQLMLAHAQAYLQGGDVALGAAHNEKTPRVAADEFRALLYQATVVYAIVPSMAAYLEKFPSASLPDSEQFLYWAKGGAGPEASISLHHLVISKPPGGDPVVVDKQVYASRYTDAAMFVISLASAKDPGGYYVLLGARARSTMLGGTMARVMRSRVQNVTLDTAKMYLDWVQESMAQAR